MGGEQLCVKQGVKGWVASYRWVGYKYLQKPTPENADRHGLTCTCSPRSEKAACSAEAEMSEGNYKLGLIIVQHGASPGKVQMSPNL